LHLIDGIIRKETVKLPSEVDINQVKTMFRLENHLIIHVKPNTVQLYSLPSSTALHAILLEEVKLASSQTDKTKDWMTAQIMQPDEFALQESFKETTRVFIYKVATLDKGNTFLQRFATLSFQKTLWDRCEEHDFIYICVKAGDELIIYDHSRLSIIAEIKSSKDESLTSHFATDISKEYSLLNLFYIVKD